MSKVQVIAEIGVNHNGSVDMAKDLIDAASISGVDAVKFQSFNTDKVLTYNAPKANYQIRNTEINETQFEMIKKLEFNQEQHIYLKEYCHKKNIEFLSSPFDLDSLDFLVGTLQLSTIKIASGEVTNAPLLLKAARYGKKIILSTGMCSLGDIEEALGVLAFGYIEKKKNPSYHDFKKAFYSQIGQEYLTSSVTLLHCTTQYPAPLNEINLRVLQTLKQSFGLPVGYSDHTLGIAVPIAATTLGATVIEKHLTLDRNLPGPDHKASLEPEELKHMVQGIRQIEKALGKPYKRPTSSELENQRIARKSIVAACDINMGEEYTEKNITVKRPGDGISPMQFWNIIGNQAEKSYKKDEVIR